MLKSHSSIFSKHFYSIFLLLLPCFAHNTSYTKTHIDPKHVLVYKNCGNNSLANTTDSPQQILSTLFDELLERSSKSKFYQTSVDDNSTAISGLYQCRNDLSQDDCQNCIKQIPKISKPLCGTQIPSRIHLSGCYVHYKEEGYESSRLEVQQKKCGDELDVGNFEGFEEIKERALGGVGDCVVEGEGSCDTRYEGMHVLAQCGGDLGRCECAECIDNANEILGDECKYSISGEVYLDGCFVSYSYSYSEDGHPGHSDRGYGSGRHGQGKLVAIVVGGIALLALGTVFLSFFRSWRGKRGL